MYVPEGCDGCRAVTDNVIAVECLVRGCVKQHVGCFRLKGASRTRESHEAFRAGNEPVAVAAISKGRRCGLRRMHIVGSDSMRIIVSVCGDQSSSNTVGQRRTRLVPLVEGVKITRLK